jgi:lysozyme family protein
VNTNFDTALAHVFEFEGGYTDDPRDPGGATNLGITRAELERIRGRSVSKDDVRALKRDEAAGIYRRNYWRPASCERLPDGVDLAVFDCAVNQGVSCAVKLLQRSLGVSPDGVVGPNTLESIGNASPKSVLAEFMAQRMRRYGSLTVLFDSFGLGWSRRLMATYERALRLADRGAATASAAAVSVTNTQEHDA